MIEIASGSGRALALLLLAVGLIGGCGDGDGGSSNSPESVEVVVPGQFPNTGSQNAGAILFAVVPAWNGDDSSEHIVLDIRRPTQFTHRLGVFKLGVFLRIAFVSATGREADVTARIDAWRPGETHTIAVTWEGGEAHVFIDGQPAASIEYDATFDLLPGTPITSGSDNGVSASVERVTIYRRSVTADEVAAYVAAHSS